MPTDLGPPGTKDVAELVMTKCSMPTGTANVVVVTAKPRYPLEMVAVALPPGVIERIVEVLAPEEVWLFGSRARETNGPDSDWDLMAVLPDTAPDRDLDLAAVWSDLRELRRLRIEVIPIRRRDFDESRSTFGELAEAVAREGHVVYGR
ncbi:MAG TPA: nucleotidyltransferase domain-containing protein [Kofleriaceae bacterium]|nr:nucleotidyltransferase domain-containing protein [Kofleriaceae bacterium]